MRFVEPKFEIVKQNSGLDGMFELITNAGYTCYKSTKEITPESARKFTEALIKNGHGAMLEHGTVYLVMPWTTTDFSAKVKSFKYKNNHFSKVKYVEDGHNHLTAYVTTNYRVIAENNWFEDLEYWSEPTPYHEKRITVRFWMDRIGTQSVERHRGENGISFAQESTRHCNYSKEEKFGKGGVKISVPHWTSKNELESIVNNKDNYTTTLDLIFHEFLNGKETELKNPIANKLYYWLAANDFSEFCYLRLIDCGTPAEDARAVLPFDLDSEMIMTAFEKDWEHFFDLRSRGTTGRPHPDIKKIADALLAEFETIKGESEQSAS